MKRSKKKQIKKRKNKSPVRKFKKLPVPSQLKGKWCIERRNGDATVQLFSNAGDFIPVPLSFRMVAPYDSKEEAEAVMAKLGLASENTIAIPAGLHFEEVVHVDDEGFDVAVYKRGGEDSGNSFLPVKTNVKNHRDLLKLNLKEVKAGLVEFDKDTKKERRDFLEVIWSTEKVLEKFNKVMAKYGL